VVRLFLERLVLSAQLKRERTGGLGRAPIRTVRGSLALAPHTLPLPRSQIRLEDRRNIGSRNVCQTEGYRRRVRSEDFEASTATIMIPIQSFARQSEALLRVPLFER
jgi:hypothetical protein